MALTRGFGVDASFPNAIDHRRVDSGLITREGLFPDPITTAAELTKRGEIARVGGAPYLHTLVNAVPTAANAEYYAEIRRLAATPGERQRVRDQGGLPMDLSPAETTEFVRREIETWGRVIRAGNLRLD